MEPLAVMASDQASALAADQIQRETIEVVCSHAITQCSLELENRRIGGGTVNVMVHKKSIVGLIDRVV